TRQAGLRRARRLPAGARRPAHFPRAAPGHRAALGRGDFRHRDGLCGVRRDRLDRAQVARDRRPSGDFRSDPAQADDHALVRQELRESAGLPPLRRPRRRALQARGRDRSSAMAPAGRFRDQPDAGRRGARRALRPPPRRAGAAVAPLRGARTSVHAPLAARGDMRQGCGVVPRRTLLGAAARGVGLAALALACAFLGLVALWAFAPPVSTLMAARMIEGKRYDRTFVPLKDIAPAAVASVIASEDASFCANDGVDWGALHEVLSAKGEPRRGASTITMQTAKNLFLWPGRS